MSAMLLNKDQWSAFVGKLAGEKKVWAPVKRGDIMRFEPLEEGAVPSLDFANTTVPPKTVVFPQTETLYRYRIGQAELAVPVLEGEAVLLGVRPCDARAMSIVQKLFRWDVDDPLLPEAPGSRHPGGAGLQRAGDQLLLHLGRGRSRFHGGTGPANDGPGGELPPGSPYRQGEGAAGGGAGSAPGGPRRERFRRRRRWWAQRKKPLPAAWIPPVSPRGCRACGSIPCGSAPPPAAWAAAPAPFFARPATASISRMKWRVSKGAVAGCGTPACSRNTRCMPRGTTPAYPPGEDPQPDQSQV